MLRKPRSWRGGKTKRYPGHPGAQRSHEFGSDRLNLFVVLWQGTEGPWGLSQRRFGQWWLAAGVGERGWRQDSLFQVKWLEEIFSTFSCHWSLVHPSGLVLDSLHVSGCMLICKQNALGFTPSSLTDMWHSLEHVPLPPGGSENVLSYSLAKGRGSVTQF